MKYNNEWVIKEGKNDFIFFWGNDPDYPYSQWYPSPFKVDGELFPTAEHWMMAAKAEVFGDKESRDIIMSNPNPDAAKRQGKLVKGFDPVEWDKHKFRIVVEGNSYKFSIPEFWEKLMYTGDKVLVEASPYDPIWGIGMGVDHPNINNPAKWKGQNLLGYAVMEVRDNLKITKND